MTQNINSSILTLTASPTHWLGYENMILQWYPNDAVRKTKTLNTQIFKFLSYELHRYEVEVTIRRHI